MSRSRYGTVIFDCDSTLSEICGIEELGRERRSEIEALTDTAMGGSLPLEAVYARRLELARPDLGRVQEVGQLYVDRLVPDTREVVAVLLQAGIDVRIVSSGVTPAVRRLARELGIADDHVAAVDVHFGTDGRYEGFDATSPLIATDGKRQIVMRWRDTLTRPIMLVGDGATDLQAKPAVDLFVAFAGVEARPAVMAGADVVIREKSMAPVLALALDRAPEYEPARGVYERGLALLQVTQAK
jgi:phosphoserine phosphatase